MKRWNYSDDDTDKEQLYAGYQFGEKASKQKTRFNTSTWLEGNYGSLFWIWIKILTISVLFNSRHRLCSQALYQRKIKQFRTTKRRVSVTRTNTKRKSNEKNWLLRTRFSRRYYSGWIEFLHPTVHWKGVQRKAILRWLQISIKYTP